MDERLLKVLHTVLIVQILLTGTLAEKQTSSYQTEKDRKNKPRAVTFFFGTGSCGPMN